MEQQYKNRKYVFMVTIVLVSIIFIARLFVLQVLDSTYKLSAENNVFRYVTQYPARGLIFDRNEELLVYNEAAYDLMVVPRHVKDFDTTDLCKILEITKTKLIEELQKAKKYSGYKPSIIVTQISSKKYAILQEKMFKFKGFYVQTRTLRKYPSSIAAHVLGYVGEVNDRIIKRQPYYKSGDYIGISGIEKSYEKELRGNKGIKIFLVDVHNRIKGNYKDGKYDSVATVGSNLITSLDAQLQKYGEILMKNKRGSVVAIEPATGEILSLVSSPNYDPNSFVGRNRARSYKTLANDNKKPLFNRALRAQYPPGSTFKMVNALIGLEEKVINPKSVFVSNYGYRVGSHVVKDHIGGPVTFLMSLQHSSNVYYCNVFQRTIDDRKFTTVSKAYNNWRQHVQSFGLGKKLNTDLSHELAGIIYDADYYNKYYGKNKWKSYTIISMAIGQGELGFTPLQIANMVATIANRGYYKTPHIVKKIMGKDSIDRRFFTKHYTNIKPEYYNYIVDGMELVVNAGTARSAFVPHITICGKTGTAQNPHGKDHSIFVAFAPKDNPKIAIAVYVENAGYGSTWAAPIASLMIEKYLTDSISRPYVEKRIIDANLIDIE